MTMVNVEPAARRMAALVSAVTDDQLRAPTPCPHYSVADLLDHIGGLSIAFTEAATKTGVAGGGPPPPGDRARLGTDWRKRIPTDLAHLADAWREPDAWTGTTSAGGVELPGAVAGLLALNELVVHGWDLARATAQPYDADPASVDAARDFAAQFASSDREAGPDVAFGPSVTVPDDAPGLDRLVGLSGRDAA
jgi:uncharacterized protein (TIGR03086 family)